MCSPTHVLPVPMPELNTVCSLTCIPCPCCSLLAGAGAAGEVAGAAAVRGGRELRHPGGRELWHAGGSELCASSLSRGGEPGPAGVPPEAAQRPATAAPASHLPRRGRDRREDKSFKSRSPRHPPRHKPSCVWTGARAKAWCLLIHTEASISLSSFVSS